MWPQLLQLFCGYILQTQKGWGLLGLEITSSPNNGGGKYPFTRVILFKVTLFLLLPVTFPAFLLPLFFSYFPSFRFLLVPPFSFSYPFGHMNLENGETAIPQLAFWCEGELHLNSDRSSLQTQSLYLLPFKSICF